MRSICSHANGQALGLQSRFFEASLDNGADAFYSYQINVLARSKLALSWVRGSPYYPLPRHAFGYSEGSGLSSIETSQ